jgi:hypothetical protein
LKAEYERLLEEKSAKCGELIASLREKLEARAVDELHYGPDAVVRLTQRLDACELTPGCLVCQIISSRDSSA